MGNRTLPRYVGPSSIVHTRRPMEWWKVDGRLSLLPKPDYARQMDEAGLSVVPDGENNATLVTRDGRKVAKVALARP